MLTIRRDKNKVDENIPYQIWINQILMGTIENDEMKSFDLKKGNYKMQIKGSKLESNVVKFNITDGSYVEYTCCPRWNGTIYSKLYYCFFRKRKGISLNLKQDIYL